jgi:hypothetical protein
MKRSFTDAIEQIWAKGDPTPFDRLRLVSLYAAQARSEPERVINDHRRRQVLAELHRDDDIDYVRHGSHVPRSEYLDVARKYELAMVELSRLRRTLRGHVSEGERREDRRDHHGDPAGAAASGGGSGDVSALARPAVTSHLERCDHFDCACPPFVLDGRVSSQEWAGHLRKMGLS